MSNPDPAQRAWIVKATWDRIDRLVPHVTATWGTKKPPKGWNPGDRLYFWQGSPKLRIESIGVLVDVELPEHKGEEARFLVRYVSGLLDKPVGINALREDPVVGEASFLKSGPAGTLFPLTDERDARIAEMILEANPDVEHVFADWEGHIRGSSAIFDSDVDREEIDDLADIQSGLDAREFIVRAIARRRGQPQFRQELLRAYGTRCAITGTEEPSCLEAAHIWPYKGEHTNTVRNGLLLRADIHTLFDLNLIAINPETHKVAVSNRIQDPDYRKLEGKGIRLPGTEGDTPFREALADRWLDFVAD